MKSEKTTIMKTKYRITDNISTYTIAGSVLSVVQYVQVSILWNNIHDTIIQISIWERKLR